MDTYILLTLDALLITNPTNIRYLTGFVSMAPDAREAYLLITKDKKYLFTHTMYLEQAKNLKSQTPDSKQKSVTIVEISREEPFIKKLNQTLAGLNPARRQIHLGFEETDLIVIEYEKFRKELPDITFVSTTNRIENLRMIKRDDEIEYIRQAGKLTDTCFDYILGKLKPGVSENDIAWDIESFIRTHGAALAFPPIVAFGKHSSQPHYQSMNHEPLTNNSLILLDFGARIKGYCADMTRVIFLGKPKDEWRRAYETVLMAQNEALKSLAGLHPVMQGATLPERSGTKLDRIAQDVIQNAGYPPYPHSLGHNIGLDIHESPRLTVRKDANLVPGMVFTIEPGIYIEGSYGIRIEDLVVLTSGGFEVLSKSPKKLTIL